MLIRRREIDFLLKECEGLDGLLEHPRFRDHDSDTVDGLLNTAYAIAEQEFEPFAAKADIEEPRFEDGKVRLIPESFSALRAYCDAGFLAAAFSEEDGGLQFPWSVTQAAQAVFASANVGFQAYGMLTVGAANLLRSFGSEDLKARFLPGMLEGRFFGTMCLSETQAGSSLADLSTIAEPSEDGDYSIRGTKMWISAGDHALSENIVHMVLAKIPGGPPGVKGISLFLVPRNLVDDRGQSGASNNVALAGLNHKMGWRATVNTVLNFGEGGPCKGYLVGQAHRGLAYMFQMMNEARISVGMSASALGYVGYMHSLDYARNRPQGRPLDSKDPAQAPVPIIQHPDIARLLLAQKAYSEGGLALSMHCARLIDELAIAESEEDAGELQQLLGILTPIAKSWPSEFCLEANKHAIQVLGGYGYTRDYPVERLYRDNRLNPIHEGTHGIQGLDLLGRKVMQDQGAAFRLLLKAIGKTCETADGNPRLAAHARSLCAAMEAVQRTTEVLGKTLAAGQVKKALANASMYLDTLGHLVLAWVWLRQAIIADASLARGGTAGAGFYRGKLAACDYFFCYEVPKIATQCQVLSRLDETFLEVPDDWY